jgi:hypothetical protein
MPTQYRYIQTVDTESFPYIIEHNVSVHLGNDAVVRCNVYRPKPTTTEARYPVLVTYGPYGKDVSYQQYVRKNNIAEANALIQLYEQGSILRVSRRYTQSTKQNILHGRLQHHSFGPATDMSLYELTKSVLGNLPVSCMLNQQRQLTAFAMSSNGLHSNPGPQEKSGSSGSATMPRHNGKSQLGVLKA